MTQARAAEVVRQATAAWRADPCGYLAWARQVDQESFAEVLKPQPKRPI